MGKSLLLSSDLHLATFKESQPIPPPRASAITRKSPAAKTETALHIAGHWGAPSLVLHKAVPCRAASPHGAHCRPPASRPELCSGTGECVKKWSRADSQGTTTGQKTLIFKAKGTVGEQLPQQPSMGSAVIAAPCSAQSVLSTSGKLKAQNAPAPLAQQTLSQPPAPCSTDQDSAPSCNKSLSRSRMSSLYTNSLSSPTSGAQCIPQLLVNSLQTHPRDQCCPQVRKLLSVLSPCNAEISSSRNKKNGGKTQHIFLPFAKIFCFITDPLDEVGSPGWGSVFWKQNTATYHKSMLFLSDYFNETLHFLVCFQRHRVTQVTDAPEYIRTLEQAVPWQKPLEKQLSKQGNKQTVLQSLGSHSNTFGKYFEGSFPSSFSLYHTDLSLEGIWLAPSSKEVVSAALGNELQHISPLHPRECSPDLKGLWV